MRRPNKFMDIFRVVAGNFLEMFDFMVYGYYASYIGETFFPSENPSAALLKSLAAFGAGFLMRPLGAFFLGAYTDRKGRRDGLLLTLSIMAVGTFLIAVTPAYGYIGALAPVIIVISRLMQGFSGGAELGGTSVYLAEISKPRNRGFYVSWQSASQQVSVIFASGIGVFLHSYYSLQFMSTIGWRIPFIIGCLIVPVVFYIRSTMLESEVFQRSSTRPQLHEVLRSLVKDYQLIILGMMMVGMTTGTFYLITAYMPTFGMHELHLSSFNSLFITACIGLSNFIWLPIMGSVSDKVGRKPLLLGATIVTVLTAFPLMAWLASAPSFAHLLIVGLWFSFLFGTYNGAMVVALAEIMPASVRATGFSLAYSLATAIFGGFTPFICTFLIEVARQHLQSGHAWLANSVPGLWLTFIAILSLIAVMTLYHNRSHLKYSHKSEF